MLDDFYITQSGFIIPNPHEDVEHDDSEKITTGQVYENLVANAKKKEKEFHAAIYKLAVFFSTVGSRDLAISNLEFLIENSQNAGDKGLYCFQYGQMMEQVGDFEKAVSYYQKAFALEPAGDEIWYFIHNNLGYSLNKLGRFEEGERFCRAAIKIQPFTHNAYKNLAIALEGQGKYVEAAENYIQATKHNVLDARAYHHLEDLLGKQPQLLTDNPEIAEGLTQCEEASRIAREIEQDPQGDHMQRYSLVHAKPKDAETRKMLQVREQLDIPRQLAKAMGEEAVEILARGFYTNPDGNRVKIAEEIRKSVRGSITYAPGIDPLTIAKGTFSTKKIIRNTTTLAAVRTLLAEGFNPAALNMASANSPGGGFLSGGRAQEEYLCRSSALYYCLRGNPMYDREDFAKNPFYDHYVIYSPDVVVFRDDNGELLEKPYTCSIITSPAVQAVAVQKYLPGRVNEIKGVMWERILKVLGVAHKHGHNALVLGAWGCGAFGNDGHMIAGLFKQALADNYKGAFSKVVFAISDWSNEQRFIGPFREVFG